MVEVFLFILKIIGIVLGSILLFLLSAICLVLFVPIRYNVQAKLEESFLAEGRISWLFHFLSIRFHYERASLFQVRILGILIYDSSKQEAKQAKKQARLESKKRRKKDSKKDNSPNEDSKNLDSPNEDSENQDSQNDKVSQPLSLSEEPKEESTKEESTKEEVKMTFLEKMRLFFRKIWNGIINIKYTFQKIYDKMIQTVHNINNYIEIWEEKETQEAFLLCKKSVLRILKQIKPKKFRLYLHIGTDDPAVTGQLLVWYSMLYPKIGQNIILEPEYETFVLEGKLYARGSITIVVFLSIAWKLFFDSNIRTVIKRIRKEEL